MGASTLQVMVVVSIVGALAVVALLIFVVMRFSSGDRKQKQADLHALQGAAEQRGWTYAAKFPRSQLTWPVEVRRLIGDIEHVVRDDDGTVLSAAYTVWGEGVPDVHGVLAYAASERAQRPVTELFSRKGAIDQREGRITTGDAVFDRSWWVTGESPAAVPTVWTPQRRAIMSGYDQQLVYVVTAPAGVWVLTNPAKPLDMSERDRVLELARRIAA